MQVYKWHHTASWDTLGSKPPEFSGGFAEDAISRIALSERLFRLLTYALVRSAPEQALFRALHRNIALSELALVRASLNTPSLIRRRSHEQHERDVLRHDVISFGVEPLTKRSQGVSPLERRGDRVSAEGRRKVRRQCAI